jgi:hypothetical protein
MDLTHCKTPAKSNSEISFPILECWNPMTKVATIAAEINGKRVLCRISMEILQKSFRASADQPMRSVVENRSVIEAAAKNLIENKAYEEDGHIVIQQRDINFIEQ